MKFKGTNYKLVNVRTGRKFDDDYWTLADPEDAQPALVRAEYENKKFEPLNLRGLYRYANWLPIKRTLRNSHAPVTYKSKRLAEVMGLENLYLTFSGYCPRIKARMETCAFKETEAYTICARLPKDCDKILVVASAGNTARAFAKVCSDNHIPIVICIPEDNWRDMWFRKRLNSCVKIVAAPKGCDYYDAIALSDKICTDPRFLAEGGAKNVARRDGMGTTVLNAVEVIGRIPDAYFQAVGSGTGAIAAWENAQRLEADGRFGKNHMKIFVSQNDPFTIMYDSWKAGSRDLLPITAEQSRHDAEVILAKVLSNRKPPYSIAGGLYDVLKASGGDFFKVSNDDIIYWLMQFIEAEGYDLFPAAACAVASLAQAIEEGKVKRDEVIMLNLTGGGLLQAMRKGFVRQEPEMVIDPELPANEIVEKVLGLFDEEKPVRWLSKKRIR